MLNLSPRDWARESRATIPQNITKDERVETALSLFLKAIDIHKLSKDLPKEIAANPDILGQVVHSVVGGCAVYVMPCKERSSSTRYMKIGMARNIEKRMEGLATANPLSINRALYFCCGSQGHTLHMEKALHAMCDEYRCRGEWFMFSGKQEMAEVMKNVVEFAESYLGQEFNQYMYRVGHYDEKHVAIARAYVKGFWEKVESIVDGPDYSHMFAQLTHYRYDNL